MNSAENNSDWIDGSLYPDRPVPDRIDTLGERIDFIARVCGAWDFGIIPRARTLQQILQPDWRRAVDETQMLTSCAYHLLRERHGLPQSRYLGPRFPYIENDPCLKMM